MSIFLAIDSLKQGKVVAMPTETVYGLAAPVNRIDLINKIFTLKKRPSFDPLIVHVVGEEMAKKYSERWPDVASKLIKAFWPGPLTLIVKKNTLIDNKITSGLDTVGLRCPRHDVALSFIKELGLGVAAPSANTFTKTSPTSLEHVKKYFKEEDVYFLEGGKSQVGIESTIVDVSGDVVKILRPGMISSKDIENVIQEKVIAGAEHLKSVPGSHHVHYLPDYPLILDCEGTFSRNEDDYLLDINKSAPILARELYDIIHTPLPKGYKRKVISLAQALRNFPNDPWDGILNRLKKASIQDY